MSSREAVLQSDIARMKTEADGSFKRAAASFRNTIEKGGKFEAEGGAQFPLPLQYLSADTRILLQTDTTYTFPTLAVSA